MCVSPVDAVLDLTAFDSTLRSVALFAHKLKVVILSDDLFARVQHVVTLCAEPHALELLVAAQGLVSL